jgi:hypothetical protein
MAPLVEDVHAPGMIAPYRWKLPRPSGCGWSKECETDQGTGQVQEPLEEVGPALVANPEAAAAEQPGERALDDPPVSPQPLARIDPAPRDPRGNAASAQATAQVRGIVGLVSVELGRALARPPRFPRGSMIEGIASTRGTSSVESWALAAERYTADGMPLRSTIK